MGRTLPRRKVLIIENDPDIRNVLYVLMAKMGWEGEAAHNFRNALSRISTERFDAVLLDLQCCEGSAEQTMSQIQGLRPSLVGRVLVITGEVMCPDTLDTIERHCLAQVPRRNLARDLLAALRSLI